MSRFDAARRNKILVWTGAALAWATAATMTGQASSSAKVEGPATPDPIVSDATDAAAFPTPPAGGLVVIRHQTIEPPAPLADDGRETAAAAGPLAASQPEAPAPAPTPVSSGS